MVSNDTLFTRAQSIIPGGVNSPVRAFRSVGGTPRFIVRGAGPYVWDAEGRRYVDYIGSWGPLILGHAHPAVVRAVQDAAARGLSYGMPTEAEIEIAERVCALVPSMERVRFTSSGTEAAMTAIRLARGFTGRDIIIKFEGCYHGHADALLVKAGSGLLTHGQPSSSGVPKETTQHTMVLDYNDAQQLEDAFREHGKRIAAVMVEPVAGNMNLVPGAPEFLRTMRELCTRHGSTLVFDEVMSGFRVALGGAQSLYGITPDVTVLGKVIGGGMPVAALGGRRDIMEHLSPLGGVYQAGTLSGNPVSVAAGLATLSEIAKPGFYEALAAITGDFTARMNAAASAAGVPFCAASVGGMFGIFARATPPASYAEVMQSDKPLFNRFFHLMLDAGVHFAPSAYEAGFVSSAHDAAAIDFTLAAATQAFGQLTLQAGEK
ncbi:MAG: glutamate-1-semialdehyde 2,1-aminomutase [Burkholderiales bacterium]|nr:glutamate-1-semialdehyde 2,1-aminomutase [Burkholderiales bacterium]